MGPQITRRRGGTFPLSIKSWWFSGKKTILGIEGPRVFDSWCHELILWLAKKNYIFSYLKTFLLSFKIYVKRKKAISLSHVLPSQAEAFSLLVPPWGRAPAHGVQLRERLKKRGKGQEMRLWLHFYHKFAIWPLESFFHHAHWSSSVV